MNNAHFVSNLGATKCCPLSFLPYRWRRVIAFVVAFYFRHLIALLVVQMHFKLVKGNVDVLDMCTGSGCIAISIDRLCENAKVTAVDFSEKALVVAKENNALNKADVTFFQSDLFENVEKQYDVIVSNPPYIKTEEIESLMDEVRIHEPMMALDGDCDGLKFYKKIAKEGRQYLRSNGIIFFEIGYDQGQTVPAILEENGYKDIKVYKDLSGNDRVVTAGKE